MGNPNKKNLIKIAAPQHVTQADPMVISFGAWKPEDLPMEITVEVVEIDRTGNASDDNFKSAEDIVVRYVGSLSATADGSAVFTAKEDPVVTSPQRSSDRVFVRFANQGPAEVVEAGIPFSAAIAAVKKSKGVKKKKGKPAEFSANEGSFYELAARIRAGHGEAGNILFTSAASIVRQRAFVLVAVEPLSQNDSGMKKGQAVRILETYHPKNQSDHQPRKWGKLSLRIRNYWPMELGTAGCSYAIMTMLLRYLRVDKLADVPQADDAPADELDARDPVKDKTETLFERHIKLGELEKSPKSKPRFVAGPYNPESVLDTAIGLRAKEREAFAEHFVAAKEAARGAPFKKGRDNKLKAFRKTFNRALKKAKQGLWIAADEVESIAQAGKVEVETKTISAQDFLPMLAWKLNVIDGREETYALHRVNVSRGEVELTGASDYRVLGDKQHGSWKPSFKKVPVMTGGHRDTIVLHVEKGFKGETCSNDKAILIPTTKKLKQAFGLIQTAPHIEPASYPLDQAGDAELHPWQRFFVETLDRGLPIACLFSPGQHSLRDTGGHFCIVVGYRFRPDADDPAKKSIRFIINDPAGGLTFQYEALDQQDLEGRTQARGPKEREKAGLNLIIERRKLLSLREIRVFEPGAEGSSTWVPERHGRWLFFKGKVNDVSN